MTADILDMVDELGDRATPSSVLGVIKTVQSKYRTRMYARLGKVFQHGGR